jgi:hypothetical protein
MFVLSQLAHDIAGFEFLQNNFQLRLDSFKSKNPTSVTIQFFKLGGIVFFPPLSTKYIFFNAFIASFQKFTWSEFFHTPPRRGFPQDGRSVPPFTLSKTLSKNLTIFAVPKASSFKLLSATKKLTRAFARVHMLQPTTFNHQ